jgi:hypothetical protein
MSSVLELGLRAINYVWRKLDRWHEKPAGDVSHVLDQLAVNVLYAKLYEKIKQAMDGAASLDQKLVILLGEAHTYTHSLLQNLMIADIAARLGIKAVVIEGDEIGLRNNEGKSQQLWKNASQANNSLGARNLPGNHCRDELTAQEKKDIDLVAVVLRIAYALGPDKAEHHSEILDEFVRAHQSYLKVGDPLASQFSNRLDEALEAAMATAIASVSENSIACYGYFHLPVLYDALASKSSIALLAFNTSNLKRKGTARYRIQRRFKRLAELERGPQPRIECPVINGALPSRAMAYKIAMEASLHHRETAQGIADPLPANKAAALRSLMEAVDQDCVRGQTNAAGR